MEKNKSTTYIVITVIVLIGIFFLLKLAPKKAVPETIDEPVVVDTNTWAPEEIKKKQIKDSGTGYDIEVFYPETNSPAVTKYMQDYAEEVVAQFKNDTAWVTDPNLPKDSSSVNVTLSMDYTSERSDTVQNYIFLAYSDTGGAHGMTVTTTFSFLKSGERITIDNLFTDQTKGLKVLSDYAIAEIKRRNISDDAWITDGAGPQPEKYRVFTLGNEGVTVIFDPYQVAAYVAGIQKVTVPFSVFGSLINPLVIAQ